MTWRARDSARTACFARAPRRRRSSRWHGGPRARVAPMASLRTHTCGELRREHAEQTVRLSGWLHRKRDHGNLLFIDLRDHYGITQCVLDSSSPLFKAAEALRLESVITVAGKVVPRAPAAVNPRLPTGEIELVVDELTLQSAAESLPLQVNSDAEFPEETRLRYRFLDLRREKPHRNIVLRSRVIASIRRRMIEAGFTEFQTPILTSSSPEGARDYLVPSRVHPGKFYALPQAPQQFKQLLMTAGFDRYFQIAPCFRDEDGRADRSPGEFYQLDFEMAFVTQEDVFATIEPVLRGVFDEFAGGATVTPAPFPRIPFDEAMTKYGSDKPDLRNPLLIADVTDVFRDSGFAAFATAVSAGAVVRAVAAPKAAGRPRGARDARPSHDQGVPVRHRLQRRRAVERRDPQPSSRHHVQGVRDRRLRARRGGGALRRHAERVPLRRAAARRLRAGHR